MIAKKNHTKNLFIMWSSLILMVGGSFILLDTAFYHLLPKSWTQFAPEYRHHPVESPNKSPNRSPGRSYPRYYFRADPLLGFDIAAFASGKHSVRDGLEYEIFANGLGCFDKNVRKDFFSSPKGYVYFAGDSYTWGYARYEDKFATVWEKNTGMLAAKCGVTHTGTRHQFEKFKKNLKIIGRQPKTVFVGFSANDIVNNVTFPHSTVIDGFSVDTVFATGQGQFTRVSSEELRQAVTPKITAIEEEKKRRFLRTRVLAIKR